MELEPGLPLDAADTLDEYGQMLGCPYAGAVFPCAPSARGSTRPVPRGCTPNESTPSRDASPFESHQMSQHAGVSTMPFPKCLLDGLSTEPGQASFPEVLHSTPAGRAEWAGADSAFVFGLNMHFDDFMGPMTSDFSMLYTNSALTGAEVSSLTMPLTTHLSSSEAVHRSGLWAGTDGSPVTFSSEQDGTPAYRLERHLQLPSGRDGLQNAPSSPARVRACGKTMPESKPAVSKRGRVSPRASEKMPPTANDNTSITILRAATLKCDYRDCQKAFCRAEHLKRHKQAFHGEGPNRFLCEFCGKNQFNRRDNLNMHRKLHARPKANHRGVEFVPAAIRVLEQEERRRKRQASSRLKMATRRE